MGEPVVLPKFELPGNRPHWAIRAAWMAGGLLLLSVIGLVVVIMHHRTLETQAHIAKAEALARVRAEAEARVAAAAAAATAARAEREAAHAAKLADQSVPATTVPSTGTVGDVPGTVRPAKVGHGHRAHPSRGSKNGKMAAKSGGKTDSGRPPSSGKPDAIDELLKKMK